MSQPDFFDAPHIALRKEAQALKESVAGVIVKANELDRKAIECCPHEETKVVENYFSGSYYDKAHTTYTTKCTFCNKILKEDEKEHSWYG